MAHERGGGHLLENSRACVCACVHVRARFHTVGWTGGVRIVCIGSGRGAKPPSQCQAEHHTDIGCSYTYYYLYSIIRCRFFSRSRIPTFQNTVYRYNYIVRYLTGYNILHLAPARRHRLFITVSVLIQNLLSLNSTIVK